MNRSPIAATLVVCFFIVGVPIVLVERVTDGLLPTQAYDVVLGVGVIAWVFIAKAILDRNAPLSTLIENRLSPSWQAHSLVEQSLLGVGFTGRGTAVEPSPRIHQLQSPLLSIGALLPPDAAPLRSDTSGRTRPELGEGGRYRSQPTLRNEPAVPPFLETEEFIVGRADTFWSLAEQRLGDGREWKAVEQVNVGREVAPGVVFRTGDSIRIGWSLLVPAVEESANVS